MRRLANIRAKISERFGKGNPFEVAVERLGVTESGWLVLYHTNGLRSRSALAGTAADLGFPVERAERIRKRAVENVYNNFSAIAPILKAYENEVRSETLLEAELIDELRRITQRHGWGEPTPEQIRGLLAALRAVAAERPSIARSLPRLTNSIVRVALNSSLTADQIEAFEHAEDLDATPQSVQEGNNPKLGAATSVPRAKTTSVKPKSVQFAEPVSTTSIIPSVTTPGDASKRPESSSVPANQITDAISGLWLSEKQWEVLYRRLGPGKRDTLAVVAADLGLSRARIQQIQKRSTAKILQHRRKIESVLADLEDNIDASWAFDAAGHVEATVSSTLLTALDIAGYADVTSIDAKKLIVALRAIVDEFPAFAELFPKLTFAACAIDPPVRAHAALSRRIQVSEQQAKEQSRTWTYEELAEAVLREAGEPLHWKVIANRAEALGHRKEFFPTSLYNTLGYCDEIFVTVGQGTYALRAWGARKAEPYTEIIADILRSQGKPLTAGAIFNAVNQIREAKPTSLTMLLDLNARFYKSVDGEFGLRAWLPIRSKQTLRSPSWQVEDPKSYERVKRAKERGYNVEAIVERDRRSITD